MHIEQFSSYGLCFCRCFLTGFGHKCSLPRNDFLLPLFNMVAHRGHAANKKVAANKKIVAANQVTGKYAHTLMRRGGLSIVVSRAHSRNAWPHPQ